MQDKWTDAGQCYDEVCFPRYHAIDFAVPVVTTINTALSSLTSAMYKEPLTQTNALGLSESTNMTLFLRRPGSLSLLPTSYQQDEIVPTSDSYAVDCPGSSTLLRSLWSSSVDTDASQLTQHREHGPPISRKILGRSLECNNVRMSPTQETGRKQSASGEAFSSVNVNNAGFERPPNGHAEPFESLFPIMSRLPEEDSLTPLQSHANNDHHQEYYRPQSEISIPGTLPYDSSREGLTYTRSRLPTVDKADIALWKALHSFRPLTSDYAGDFQTPSRSRKNAEVVAPHPISADATSSACPFISSDSAPSRTALDLVRSVFNWSALQLPRDTSASWYGVVFRSKRAPGSESTNLYLADKLAHEEAVTSGGLLMYFYGAPDPVTGSNLATCVWRNRADARKASALPLHAKAAVHAKKAYEGFELSRYRVVKRSGEETLRIEEWTDESEQ